MEWMGQAFHQSSRAMAVFASFKDRSWVESDGAALPMQSEPRDAPASHTLLKEGHSASIHRHAISAALSSLLPPPANQLLRSAGHGFLSANRAIAERRLWLDTGIGTLRESDTPDSRHAGWLRGIHRSPSPATPPAPPAPSTPSSTSRALSAHSFHPPSSRTALLSFVLHSSRQTWLPLAHTNKTLSPSVPKTL